MMKKSPKKILYPLLTVLVIALAVMAFYQFNQHGSTSTVVDKNGNHIKRLSPAQTSKTSHLGH